MHSTNKNQPNQETAEQRPFVDQILCEEMGEQDQMLMNRKIEHQKKREEKTFMLTLIPIVCDL
jgi:hypothetical protein